MDAENQKSESGREHQKRATLFHAAEQKVSLWLPVAASCWHACRSWHVEKIPVHSTHCSSVITILVLIHVGWN